MRYASQSAGWALTAWVLLISGVTAHGQPVAPLGPKDTHTTISMPDGECFARWDPLFEGWWVMSPGTTPSCESRDDGSVRCDATDSLSTLYAHEYLPGRRGYRCGPEVAAGAGCVFITPEAGEPFECTPRSGISLVCIGEQRDRDCLEPLRKRARQEHRELTDEELAECEKVPWLRVISLHDDIVPLECSKIEGQDAECHALMPGQTSSASAECRYNSGTGSCVGSSGSADCTNEFSGALR